jgi:hypothetical protein
MRVFLAAMVMMSGNMVLGPFQVEELLARGVSQSAKAHDGAHEPLMPDGAYAHQAGGAAAGPLGAAGAVELGEGGGALPEQGDRRCSVMDRERRGPQYGGSLTGGLSRP